MKRITRLQTVTALSLVCLVVTSLAGCGSIVDSNPPSNGATSEPDVTQYYLSLESKGTVYHYATTATAPYHPAKADLTMEMEGHEYTYDQTLCTCDWTYAGEQPEPWYYRVTPDSIVDYGVLTGGYYSDSWVELKAPLAQGNSWTFTSIGEQITAKVEKFGVTATVGGKTFNDVIMVSYTGRATTGIQWFARGIGIIFSHIERNGTFAEEQFVSRN